MSKTHKAEPYKKKIPVKTLSRPKQRIKDELEEGIQEWEGRMQDMATSEEVTPLTLRTERSTTQDGKET